MKSSLADKRFRFLVNSKVYDKGPRPEPQSHQRSRCKCPGDLNCLIEPAQSICIKNRPPGVHEHPVFQEPRLRNINYVKAAEWLPSVNLPAGRLLVADTLSDRIPEGPSGGL